MFSFYAILFPRFTFHYNMMVRMMQIFSSTLRYCYYSLAKAKLHRHFLTHDRAAFA